MATSDFVKNEKLKIEHRLFLGRIFGSSIGYLLISWWLNSIRATTPLLFLWIMIIIQFVLYFSIFTAGYQRSKVLGFNKSGAFICFVILAVVGRINDWELLVIPLLLVVMFVLSAKNRKIINND